MKKVRWQFGQLSHLMHITIINPCLFIYRVVCGATTPSTLARKLLEEGKRQFNERFLNDQYEETVSASIQGHVKFMLETHFSTNVLPDPFGYQGLGRRVAEIIGKGNIILPWTFDPLLLYIWHNIEIEVSSVRWCHCLIAVWSLAVRMKDISVMSAIKPHVRSS